jgi:hypothetical protein
MQHHLGSDLFKGGVYDSAEAIETFSRGKAGHLVPMEVRAVHAGHRTLINASSLSEVLRLMKLDWGASLIPEHFR